MIDYEQVLQTPPYAMKADEKNRFLSGLLSDLTARHAAACPEYARILRAAGYGSGPYDRIEDIPFLPVRLFKLYSLKSVPDDEILKTMTSSGTSGQQVSRIFLDKETAKNQAKTLTRLVADFLGSKRSPMIILDSSSVLKDRNSFSARGAGILGFSIFASDKIYALDDKMELDLDGLNAFLEKHKGKTLFLFGFTFMIWLHFYQELVKRNVELDLSNGVLIHGGGWKKILSQSVSRERFKQALLERTGLRSVHDYYGMVEQTGTINIECEEGHLHPSVFSDIIIRRAVDFSVADHGETGLIQTLSILPWSYPGHSILTEDEGVVLGEDDCPCGRPGKYFHISGRIKNAEIRGCSDTYEQH